MHHSKDIKPSASKKTSQIGIGEISMSSNYSQQKQEILEKVIDLLYEKLPEEKAEISEVFIRLFYENTPLTDIVDKDIESLLGAALSLWHFGQKREKSEIKVRVFNPDIEKNGWETSHTVIEIINDDMPFIIDSLISELNQKDYTTHFIIHPIVSSLRDNNGKIKGISAFHEKSKTYNHESFVHIEIGIQTSAEVLEVIEKNVLKVLQDVRAATQDWREMVSKSSVARDEIISLSDKFPKDVYDESLEFLEWMENNHFTYLGYREYDIDTKNDDYHFTVKPDSGLGILKDGNVQVFEGQRKLKKLPPDVQEFIQKDELVFISKTNKKSTIHRSVQMDAIIVKMFDKKGKIKGERLFVGLFTSVAYNASPRRIPVMKRKVENVVKKAGLAAASHDAKALIHILETYPRDELFQISEDELFRISTSILHLQERQRIALFIRKDAFERFISCLVYIPRDQYNNSVRNRVEKVLENAFNGTVSAFYPQIADDSHLARVHFIVKTRPGCIPDYDISLIEKKITDSTRDWNSWLKTSLIEHEGEEHGTTLLRKYGTAFPISFQERFKTSIAALDILRMETLFKDQTLAMNLYRPLEAEDKKPRFKIYHLGDQIALSNILPMLENMGVTVIEENPYQIYPKNNDRVWIHDLGLELNITNDVDIAEIKERFQQTFYQLWHNSIENDGFNKLVLFAGLEWQEVVILRAYSKYLRQAGIQFSQEYMQETLNANPKIVKLLLEYFNIRFNPEYKASKEEIKKIKKSLEEALDNVVSLDQDRILRRFINLIESTLRTNFYQTGKDDNRKPYLSFKINSQQITDLPLPKPMVEIFVYSPRTEGIHLRGGKVARGGLRWSDRKEDFRTEILGLMKAQLVKNSVIVPVGSKGGFVVKNLPIGSRDEVMAEVIECYKTFIRGLLDITDNMSDDKIVPPTDVIRYDDDDPYLVVAADKGTATFSDIANEISLSYGFWLGDAFASGGSSGYDHKKMGITARGAWESVKRHFREIGINCQKQEFTCVGIGDMSGDVFGNGMLLSEKTLLVAAFNHMHIFIDPTPNAKKTFEERKRLFDLPRSSWTDYDKKLISKGGGIFERSAKSIKLTAEIKKTFNIKENEVTPNTLIKHLLMSKVDLMWFGGIGTYIKSSDEENFAVGDRANDILRINADELNCQIIGEGANLGLTQKARIEYSLHGGRLNTDAIDNSAGVDCSDHEVNIKILLDDVVSKGDLTLKQRDQLLEKMTDEVSDLVLKNNYLQSQILSISNYICCEKLDRQKRFMELLEQQNRLNRKIEFLPDNETLAEREEKKLGLTRPELAVLLAYSKITLYEDLIKSDFPDDPAFTKDLVTYFPQPIQKNYKETVERHPLRREIIATTFANNMINRSGITFVNEMQYRLGYSPIDITRAYAIARNVFDLEDIWHEIENMDNSIHANSQIEMHIEVKKLVERATAWFLRNGEYPYNIDQHNRLYHKGIKELYNNLVDVLPEKTQKSVKEKYDMLMKNKVPTELARKISSLSPMGAACDIVRIASMSNAITPSIVGKIYFALGEKFGLRWLRNIASSIPSENEWDRRATQALVEDLYSQQSSLTIRVINGYDQNVLKKNPEKILEEWAEHSSHAVSQNRRMLDELQKAEKIDLAMITVANRNLRVLFN